MWNEKKLSVFCSDSDQNSMIDHFRLIGWKTIEFFFDHEISIIQFWNDRIINNLFFQFFLVFLKFFLPMNMVSGNMQQRKSQKKISLSFFYLFFVTVTDCIA